MAIRQREKYTAIKLLEEAKVPDFENVNWTEVQIGGITAFSPDHEFRVQKADVVVTVKGKQYKIIVKRPVEG